MKVSSGNSDFDQGVNSLSGALFPDPSKVAQGYYYGSEARKAQLESNQINSKLNAQNWLTQYAAGQNPGVPVFTPTPIEGSAPIQAPPTLGATVAPMTQAQAATVPAMAQPLMTGTPPPASAPAPGAAVAPNTTGSDGSVPTNDPASGAIHPASVTPPGPRQYAGPAAPNGSPAQSAFNPMLLYQQAVNSGMDAANAGGLVRARLGDLFAHGVIAEPLYKQWMASLGEATPYTTTIQGQTQRDVANINKSAELAKQAMVTGENRRQFDYAVEPVVNPTDPTQVTMTPRKDVYGKPSYNPNAVANMTGAQTVISPTQPNVQTTAPLYQAQGKPGYVPDAAKNAAVFGNYYDEKGQIVHTTALDAQTRRLTPLANDPNAVTARAQQDLLRAAPGSEAQRIAQQNLRFLQNAQKPLDQKEAFQENYNRDIALQNIYARPQVSGFANTGVTHPVQFDEPAKDLIREKMQEIGLTRQFLSPTDQYEAAVGALIQEGKLSSPDEVNQAREAFNTGRLPLTGDVRVVKGVSPDGKTETLRMLIGVKGKNQGQGQGQTQGQKSLGNTVYPQNQPMTPQQMYGGTRTPPQTQTQPQPGGMPPGAIAPAPGAREGAIGTDPATGQRVQVRGGFTYPVQ